jgi:hypothetical protein
MTQRKLKYEEIETLRCYRSWFNRVCEYGLFADGDSHYLHVKKMIEHGTTDGKPWVEPELTDEDAKQRKLIMCRQSDAYLWGGPFILIRVTPGVLSYIAEHNPQHVCFYKHARLATPEEIEAANADR